QRIGIRALAQALLYIAHAVVAEIPHQATVEARQAVDGRYVVAFLERLDEGQRVFDFMLFDLDTVMGDAHLMVMYAQHGATWQADDRITPPLLAALHRFEQ
uniref:GNAT family N-acetyltransferase n=1 Tax=Steinernema glaseri TaxID=37863 RepID=A0A1I8APT7_9BILA